MATAQVQVLHAILTEAGWLNPGPAEMAADKAREFESRGLVDVVSVDGRAEVWAPCCNGAHNHG
jgi:hypothetical protein